MRCAPGPLEDSDKARHKRVDEIQMPVEESSKVQSSVSIVSDGSGV